MQNVNRLVADNQQSVKNSLHNLETFTGALARNSEKIDNVMARVDGVMGKADSLMLGLNSIGGGAAGGELQAMVKAIKDLAEDLDKRSGALMADGRRTLSDISRAVNNFDRNPSRVIFGGGNSTTPAPEQQPPPPRQARPLPRRSRRAGRSRTDSNFRQREGMRSHSRGRFSPELYGRRRVTIGHNGDVGRGARRGRFVAPSPRRPARLLPPFRREG